MNTMHIAMDIVAFLAAGVVFNLTVSRLNARIVQLENKITTVEGIVKSSDFPPVQSTKKRQTMWDD